MEPVEAGALVCFRSAPPSLSAPAHREVGGRRFLSLSQVVRVIARLGHMTNNQANPYGNPEKPQRPSLGSGISPNVSQLERAQLAQLLLDKGPDAPTLCDGWNTRDMVTHLVVRENRPDAAAGMFVPFLGDHLDKVSKEVAEQPYEQLVEKFRQGPPAWNPMRLGDKYINASENFIHHEDVRRGGGDTTPRNLPESVERQLWKITTQAARLMVRPDNVHVILQPEFPSSASTPTGGPEVFRIGNTASAEVKICGKPSEILLWVFGRGKAAHLTVEESQTDAKERIELKSL